MMSTARQEEGEGRRAFGRDKSLHMLISQLKPLHQYTGEGGRGKPT